MTRLLRLSPLAPAILLSLALAACGGSGGRDQPALTSQPTMATDGFNLFNVQRQRMGLASIARSPAIDIAAQGHSDYLAINKNDDITHDEDPSKNGFKGVEGCPDPLRDTPIPASESRMYKDGYKLNSPYACGEVISRTPNASGTAAAEALITAIYHRFVIFEPMFRDAGVGATSVTNGYTYFTTDFGRIGDVDPSVSPGLAPGKVAVFPYNNQQQVPISFNHGSEEPDPFPKDQFPEIGVTVGYPISVHANITSAIGVTTFTVSQNGTALPARRLSSTTDPKNTTKSAAAIIPYAPLSQATTYDVRFIGQVDNLPVDRTWSFTTK